ncbi:MAG: hypothetical protein IPH20_16485 [Bacteroidales bacterium]|nr:hypothetical protein [Bacteroidales bacterium]
MIYRIPFPNGTRTNQVPTDKNKMFPGNPFNFSEDFIYDPVTQTYTTFRKPDLQAHFTDSYSLDDHKLLDMNRSLQKLLARPAVSAGAASRTGIIPQNSIGEAFDRFLVVTPSTPLPQEVQRLHLVSSPTAATIRHSTHDSAKAQEISISSSAFRECNG